MRNILKNDFTAFLLKLSIVYVVLWLLRIMFYVYNYPSIGAIESNEIWNLIRGSFKFDSANVAYSMSLFMILSLLPFRFRERNWYRTMVGFSYALGYIAIVVWNSMDTVYFHYAHKRSTADEFAYTDNSNTWDVILKAAAENWIITLIMFLLIIIGLWVYTRIKYYPTKIRNNFGYYITSSLIFVVTVAMFVVMMRGGMGRAIRPITLSNAAQYVESPQKANIILSNPFCTLRTIGSSSIRYQKYFESEEDLESIFSPYHNPSIINIADSSNTSKATNIISSNSQQTADQKNVVIFIMESLSWEHSAYLAPEIHKDNGKGYMPYMDSLMQQGYTMHRAYANGSKSIDALPSILVSIPSLKTPFATMPQALNPMQGLGTILNKDRGYSTWFFNGSEESSMGFVAFAKLAGFQNIRTKENYEATNGTRDFDNYWGIWDAPFLRYMASELTTAQQPFVATVFTLTNHHPFVVPSHMADSLPSGHTKAHKTVAYTDYAIKQFMEYAQTQPWYQNTIFIFIADHVGSEVYAPETLSATGSGHIVYFYYTPDGSIKGQSHEIASQVDVMPTLLGLLGYDKPYFAFGRDAKIPLSGMTRDTSNLNIHPEPMAINYRSGLFQIIIDNTAYFFDENKLTSAHSLSDDPMALNNILGQNTARDLKAQQTIKAFIQNYYQHLEQGKYLPKEPLNKTAISGESSSITTGSASEFQANN